MESMGVWGSTSRKVLARFEGMLVGRNTDNFKKKFPKTDNGLEKRVVKDNLVS